MKKVSIKAKLELDKMTIAALDNHMSKIVNGGAAKSVGRDCTYLETCDKTNTMALRP